MCLAVPGRIVAVTGVGSGRAGVVEIAGVERQVSLAMTPEAAVGDYVVAHSGIAIRVLSDDEALAAGELIIEALGR